MATDRKYYRPTNNEFDRSVQLIRKVKVDGETRSEPLDIPKQGYSTTDPEIQEFLDNNRLKDHRLGFEEYRPKTEATEAKAPEPSTKVVEDVETANEAQKWLIDNIKGVGKKSTNDLEKILVVAAEHDIEFPNLEVPK